MDEADENVFSFSKIKWLIENFCFAHLPNGYTIFSSEFMLQGIKTARWRMSLELEKNESGTDGQVSFFLEKLPISKAKHVCISWEMTLKVGSNIFGPFKKKVVFSDHSKYGEIGVATVTEIINSLIPIESDEVEIKLEFVAFDKDVHFTQREQPEDGLFNLSKDVSRLKQMKSYTDLKIKVNDRCIETHKAILSLNDKFIPFIKEAKNDVIEISSFDYESLDAFLKYLYSGNEENLLMFPSLSMMRIICHFNCDAINEYYITEDIKLLSKIEVETHEFHWHVVDILGKDDLSITSPPIKAMNTVWKLTLSMKRSDPQKNLSLYAEITHGERPSKFCLEFCLINDKKHKMFRRRLLRIDGCCNNMGFDDFISKGSLLYHRSLTISGAVCIFFRVKTSTSKQVSKKGCHEVSFTSPVREENRYHKFSVNMENLLEKKTYSDIILHVRSKKRIKAHKAILVARSPGLKRRIEKDLLANEYLMVGDIDFELLKLSINYIYTGTFNGAMKKKASALYYFSAEDKLDIPSLHVDSLRYMKSEGMYI